MPRSNLDKILAAQKPTTAQKPATTAPWVKKDTTPTMPVTGNPIPASSSTSKSSAKDKIDAKKNAAKNNTGTSKAPSTLPLAGNTAYADGGDRGGKPIDKNPLASAMKPSTTTAPWVKQDTTPTTPSGNPIPTPKPSASAAAVGAVSGAARPSVTPSAPAAIVGAAGGAVGGATKNPEPTAPGVDGAGGAAGTAPDISGSIAGGAGGSGSAPGEGSTVTIEKKKADIPDFKSMLDQWLSAAKEQSDASINYGTEQGVNALQRAEEDAQQQFQAQQRQIAVDEARGLDNQALYAEARGDKGGIGAAQYNSIMSAAAQNRLAVSQQQTKLSTDTARQIADLRAQGEYKKADAVLELTQKYLSQLVSLEQWALNYQMDVDQFNFQLEKWAKSYQLELDQFNFQKQKWQADYDLTTAKFNAAQSGSGGGSGGGSSGSSSGYTAAAGMTKDEIKALQKQLGVTADGVWGPNTQAAYDKQSGSGGTGTKVASTGGFNHLLGLMSSGSLGGMPASDRTKIVENSYKAGKITRQEAEHLLDIIGV